MALLLTQSGHSVAIVDDCTGAKPGVIDALRHASPSGSISFQQVSILESDRLARIMRDEKINAVAHFAGLASVAESFERPHDYWSTNVEGTTSLLRSMADSGVRRLIFNSSCATYGVPATTSIPISEECPQRPINPYGASKAAAELAIIEHHRSGQIRGDEFAFVALRCFNVIGSDPSGRIGENHRRNSRLIPACLFACLGRREPLVIMGDDYPTTDGTCIRDYVDVGDLCRAHLAVLHRLRPRDALRLNVGTGVGHSVLEIARACQRVTGIAVPVVRGARREGEPPTLIADASKILREYGWKPAVTSIDESIMNTWKWILTHPDGHR